MVEKQTKIKIIYSTAILLFLLMVGGFLVTTFGVTGTKIQRENIESIPASYLVDYFDAQAVQLREAGYYDLSLHKKMNAQSKEGVILAFANEDPEVAKKCPDCRIDKKTFKVAGLLSRDGFNLFVTIDQSRKIESISE